MKNNSVPRRQRGKTSRLTELSLSPLILSVEETQQGGVVSAAPPNPPTRIKIMADVARINSGEVSINFGGEELVLKPTLRAATGVNRQFNGFANARQALVSENFDAAVFILRLGLNLSDKDARDLPEKVYQNGLTAEFLIPLIKYVAILGNGGRPLPDEPEDQETKDSSDPNS